MKIRSSTGRGRARRIAEEVLGKPLPPGADVHHIDGDQLNNNHTNLVICESRSYHMLLHQRADALEICGHASWRKCKYCGEYDDPSNMIVIHTVDRGYDCDHMYHRKCEREYDQKRKKEHKEQIKQYNKKCYQRQKQDQRALRAINQFLKEVKETTK